MLGNADSGDPLSEVRSRAGSRKGFAGAAAAGNPDYREGPLALAGCRVIHERSVSEVRRTRAARERHHGYVRRFLLVLLSLLRREELHRAVRFEEDRLLVPDRPVHRRRGTRDTAPDLFQILYKGDARYRPDQE